MVHDALVILDGPILGCGECHFDRLGLVERIAGILFRFNDDRPGLVRGLVIDKDIEHNQDSCEDDGPLVVLLGQKKDIQRQEQNAHGRKIIVDGVERLEYVDHFYPFLAFCAAMSWATLKVSVLPFTLQSVRKLLVGSAIP